VRGGRHPVRGGDRPDVPQRGDRPLPRSALGGTGLAREAVGLVVRHLFEARGHHRITIDPAAANERAIRCYEAVGFVRVGIMRQYERAADGTWRDGLLMELLAKTF